VSGWAPGRSAPRTAAGRSGGDGRSPGRAFWSGDNSGGRGSGGGPGDGPLAAGVRRGAAASRRAGLRVSRAADPVALPPKGEWRAAPAVTGRAGQFLPRGLGGGARGPRTGARRAENKKRPPGPATLEPAPWGSRPGCARRRDGRRHPGPPSAGGGSGGRAEGAGIASANPRRLEVTGSRRGRHAGHLHEVVGTGMIKREPTGLSLAGAGARGGGPARRAGVSNGKFLIGGASNKSPLGRAARAPLNFGRAWGREGFEASGSNSADQGPATPGPVLVIGEGEPFSRSGLPASRAHRETRRTEARRSRDAIRRWGQAARGSP